jgi:hypothetical protein
MLVPRWVDHVHAKELAAISHVLESNPSIAEAVTAGGLIPVLWLRHRIQGTTALLYDLEDGAEDQYHALYDALTNLGACSAVWNVDTSRGTGGDWKAHAGASHLITRAKAKPKTADPPQIKTNVSVVALPAGRQRLFFLPDRLFVLDRGKYAALTYENIDVAIGTTQFIEPRSVPKDATQVGTTWQYPNKKGGPDRRYKDNAQLPIMAYGTLHFTSPTGLNELFYTSRTDVLDPVRDAVRRLAEIAVPVAE